MAEGRGDEDCLQIVCLHCPVARQPSVARHRRPNVASMGGKTSINLFDVEKCRLLWLFEKSDESPYADLGTETVYQKKTLFHVKQSYKHYCSFPLKVKYSYWQRIIIHILKKSDKEMYLITSAAIPLRTVCLMSLKQHHAVCYQLF